MSDQFRGILPTSGFVSYDDVIAERNAAQALADAMRAERDAALARAAELERERDRLARSSLEWCERATAHLTQSQSLRAQLDKWQSIALDSVRGGGQKPDISERLKREAEASHALSSYTVPESGDDVLFERNNMAEALREVNARLMQTQAERDGLKARVAELEAERDRLARSRVEWVKRASEHLTESQALRAQFEAVKKDLDDAVKERNALREPLAQARMHQVTLEKRITDLERECDALRASYAAEARVLQDIREAFKNRGLAAGPEALDALMRKYDEALAKQRLLIDAINGNNDVLRVAGVEDWFLSEDEVKQAVASVLGLWNNQERC